MQPGWEAWLDLYASFNPTSGQLGDLKPSDFPSQGLGQDRTLVMYSVPCQNGQTEKRRHLFLFVFRFWDRDSVPPGWLGTHGHPSASDLQGARITDASQHAQPVHLTVTFFTEWRLLCYVVSFRKFKMSFIYWFFDSFIHGHNVSWLYQHQFLPCFLQRLPPAHLLLHMSSF